MKSPRIPQSGFSLIEVVIAIGVAAFSLLPISGLMLMGMNATQSSSEQTTAVNIGMNIVADLRAIGASGVSPQFGVMIPNAASSTPVTFYIDNKGKASTSLDNPDFASPPDAKARYRVTIGFNPPDAGSRNATLAHIMVTWPAMVDKMPGRWPTAYSGAWETITAIEGN